MTQPELVGIDYWGKSGNNRYVGKLQSSYICEVCECG